MSGEPALVDRMEADKESLFFARSEVAAHPKSRSPATDHLRISGISGFIRCDHFRSPHAMVRSKVSQPRLVRSTR